VCDALGVGLCLPDQGLQPLLQVGRGSLVEAMVDLARVDEILAPAPAYIDAVPLTFVECEASDGQCLALHTGLLHPITCASLRIGTVSCLRDDAFQAELTGVREHLASPDLETFAELDVGAIDDLLEFGLPLE